jgi:hypothetical protein
MKESQDKAREIMHEALQETKENIQNDQYAILKGTYLY